MKKTFKEFLQPVGTYSEGPMSLVVHNGILYKLDRIFELSIDLPVTMMKVDTLKWQTKITPDAARMKKADTKVPIIVTPQNGVYVILDGYHRLMKAIKNGDEKIPARVVFHDVLAIAKLGGNNQGDLNPYIVTEGFKDYKVGQGHKAVHDAFKKAKQGPGKPNASRVKRAFQELTGTSGNSPSFELEQLFPDQGREGCVDELNSAIDEILGNVSEANVFFGQSVAHESEYEFADNLHPADRLIFLDVFSARLQKAVMKIRKTGQRAKYAFEDVYHDHVKTLPKDQQKVVNDCFKEIDGLSERHIGWEDNKEVQDAVKTMKLYFK